MITNEKQLPDHAEQGAKLARAIQEFDATSDERTDVHASCCRPSGKPWTANWRTCGKLEEYERLKASDFSVISVASFEELADGLIKARIAGGLNQRALAQRLGLKEQQIQRYEAERYASASYRRLCQVARALEVRIVNEILLPIVPSSFEGLLAKVSQVLSREFVVGRLILGGRRHRGRRRLLREGGSLPRDDTSPHRRYPPNDQKLSAEGGSWMAAASGIQVAKVAPRGSRRDIRDVRESPGRRGHTRLVGYPIESIPPTRARCGSEYWLETRGGMISAPFHTVWDLGGLSFVSGNGTFHGACGATKVAARSC